MEFTTALAHVSTELTQSQAHAILNVIRLRRQLLFDQQNALAAALVSIGATVKVRGNLSEKHLRGLTGTVQTTDGKYAAVLMDETSTATMSTVTGRDAIRLDQGQTRYLFEGMPLTALETLDAPSDYADLVSFLLTEAALDQLNQVNAARKQRIDALSDDIAVGDTVMVTDASPKYFLGLTGSIEAIDKAASICTVLFDEASTNRWRQQYSTKYPVPEGVKRHRMRFQLTQLLITTTH